MKKIIVLLLFTLIMSCKDSKKTYYIVHILDKKELMNNNYHRIQEEDTVECYNDTIASNLAYSHFFLRLKSDKDLKEMNIEDFDTIVDFKLLDEKKQPIPISKILSNKQISQIEKEIFSKPNPFKKSLKEDSSNQEEQFSKWDGSHKKLTELIKSKMNNPDSYKHVETKAANKSDYILVVTTFRGENAYGATITSTYTAKCDKNTGEVLSVQE